MSARLCMAKADEIDFQKRCQFFLVKAAIAVMNENGATVNNADRIIYAQKVLSGTVVLYEIAVSVTTNGTIEANINTDTNIPDADIEFTINSMFDAFAG